MENIENIENMELYVINLKRRSDRLQRFYETIPFPPSEIHVNYGFDGKYYENESEEEKIMYNKISNKLLPGEKGCLISHIRIYKEMIKNNIPFAMIFEDDCILCDDFKNKIQLIVNEMPKDTEILYFGGRFNADFKMKDNSYKNITENIVAHNTKNWSHRDHLNDDRGTFGYIISQSLAIKLINYFENNYCLSYPVDHWLMMICMNTNIPIYNSHPLLCYANRFTTDSDIR